MSLPVARTCTEVPPEGVSGIGASTAKPLSAYRSKSAYVLLGDPGSGKTTEFVRESEALGDTAAYVTARNFVKRDLDSHPEWRDRTLFIDGLDEMRAGVSDARVPLDEIRSRLERLGTPSFRISCREADWLGPNDRRSLEEVSPDSAIAVLLLDRLSDEAARELLGTHVWSGSAQVFEDQARRRGLGGMLGSPQALKLLADAVEHGGAWPESRLETLDLACRKMATEHNDEHQAVEPIHSTEATLDAAGRLCALLLLCGFEGYTLATGRDRDELRMAGFVTLDDLGKASADPPRELLKSALSTKLFEADGEREFSPRHRQIAEFLAGRYLANLIDDGLPARRIVALMTSPSDGRVVTALRGLSAWLAAHTGEARRLLIDADPVGVGLYGDIGAFTTDDRQHLLRALAEFAAQGSLFGHARQDGRADGYREDTAWAFRSLASAEMVESIKNLLHRPTGEAHRDRTAAFVTEVLAEAEESEKQSLAVLEPDLMAILRDADRPPWVTARALDAYIHITPPGSETDETLAALLDNVQQGSIPDQHDQLRCALLEQLYPQVIRPADVWRYAVPSHRPRVIGTLGTFWDVTVLKESSDQHIAELLDSLCKDSRRLIPALGDAYLDDLPIQLLARGLEAFGDALGTEHLLDWLGSAEPMQAARHLREADATLVRDWLESRPDVQKAVFLAWLWRRVGDEPGDAHRHWFCDALHGSSLPDDFGLWCFKQATALEDSQPGVARELLDQSYSALADPAINDGLSLAIMREQIGTGLLARRLTELDCRRSTDDEIDEWRRERDERIAQRAEKEGQRQEGWRDGLRSQLDDLRHNQFFAPDLHTLAQAYLGMFSNVDRASSPRQRIHDFIGGDEVLVDAVLAAIRGAVFRDDLPTVEDTISLHVESKHSWLAYPVLASLHLLDEEDPARLDRIDTDRKRRALAIHYCVPTGDMSQSWHDRWFQQEPELVLEVLFRCAVPAVRSGEEFVPCLNALDSFSGRDDSVPVLAFDESTGLFEARPPTQRFSGHDDLVHDTRLRVLDSIPTRAPNKQMGLLDNLLARAMQYPDTVSLQELASRKLALKSMGVGQRVRWVAVAALLSGDTNLTTLKEYVCESEVRVQHLAEFLRRTSRRDDMRRSVLADVRDPGVLRDAIEILGPLFAPSRMDGFVNLGMEMSDLLGTLIEQLGTIAGDDADRAFTELTNDPRMARWRDRLTWAHERQSVVHRDASYRHPSINDTQCTLTNDAPASVVDLAALLEDRFADISADLRGGNDNPWQKYWNQDRYGRPTTPKPEGSCRDALVETLRNRLSSLSRQVSVDPETRYASETRADIGVGCCNFKVPIEVKKNSHRDLWSALRRQLMARYTTDQATAGYGIYLVLWFGPDATKPPPDGIRPRTPEELRKRLLQDLTPDEARKISVIVMDVTKPGVPPGGA